ncbi:hypothetical protein [Actinoplanes regularis]|uniref:Uncharacterized protein n=1 Tax=Actinoplanes regularis TaxID=52697 RepID=A0A239C0V1_9ACTN|nr:hypothetical protein [Actinoplanes regularis]GIE88193.1 hypothetical protein Are01nite_46730 [Actinoplanes regularis]GLW30284.1 hypothetical protein Areg01_32240 [Actinoplanes regularis]SNS13288.1 hypothetical protein SAMN06264365_110220 [Actinoplanes regularis]
MQSEVREPEALEELDLWLEDDLTAEQLPTVVSSSLLLTGGGCGHCHSCHGCHGCHHSHSCHHCHASHSCR